MGAGALALLGLPGPLHRIGESTGRRVKNGAASASAEEELTLT
jgi:hypothetical protein